MGVVKIDRLRLTHGAAPETAEKLRRITQLAADGSFFRASLAGQVGLGPTVDAAIDDLAEQCGESPARLRADNAIRHSYLPPEG